LENHLDRHCDDDDVIGMVETLTDPSFDLGLFSDSVVSNLLSQLYLPAAKNGNRDRVEERRVLKTYVDRVRRNPYLASIRLTLKIEQSNISMHGSHLLERLEETYIDFVNEGTLRSARGMGEQ